jgi:hypothetical protein
VRDPSLLSDWPTKEICYVPRIAQTTPRITVTPTASLPSMNPPAASFKFTQCFYRTPEFTSSVSVALGIPLADDDKRSGPLQYWRQQFHKKPSNVPSRKKKEPPKPVEGLGDEAFWVGDPMTGALYVLQGEVFLRVSVGGPPDQAQKIKRSKTLASYALKRLDSSRGAQ